MILQGTSYNEEEADKNRPQKRDRLFHFKDLSAGKTTKGGLDFEPVSYTHLTLPTIA